MPAGSDRISLTRSTALSAGAWTGTGHRAMCGYGSSPLCQPATQYRNLGAAMTAVSGPRCSYGRSTGPRCSYDHISHDRSRQSTLWRHSRPVAPMSCNSSARRDSAQGEKRAPYPPGDRSAARDDKSARGKAAKCNRPCGARRPDAKMRPHVQHRGLNKEETRSRRCRYRGCANRTHGARTTYRMSKRSIAYETHVPGTLGTPWRNHTGSRHIKCDLGPRGTSLRAVDMHSRDSMQRRSTVALA